MASGWNTSNSTSHWTTVVPSDSTILPETNYLYVGTTGNLVATCDGADITFNNVAVGYHPIRCTKVKTTGTTASQILAAY